MPGCTRRARWYARTVAARRIPAAWKCALVAAIAFFLRLPAVSCSLASADVRTRLEADGSFDRIELGLRAIDNADLAPEERDAQRSAFLSRQLDLAVERLSPLSGANGRLGGAQRAPLSLLQQQQLRDAAQPHHRRKLLMNDADAEEDEENVGMAMTEPTPECRRILNTWTSKCVFADKMAG